MFVLSQRGTPSVSRIFNTREILELSTALMFLCQVGVAPFSPIQPLLPSQVFLLHFCLQTFQPLGWCSGQHRKIVVQISLEILITFISTVCSRGDCVSLRHQTTAVRALYRARFSTSQIKHCITNTYKTCFKFEDS